MKALRPALTGSVNVVNMQGSQLNNTGSQDDSIDLREYINTSAVSVQEDFSVERAYMIFRSMGLRHLTVVDDMNRVKGIVTRKDLMGYRLDEAVSRTEYSRETLNP